ncbi:MAG: NAD(P)/FAD-dependent oxidoreductase [Halodesulfurarchaeum sp.]
MEEVDVAIVGGGPAGTSAARAAATRGASAIVFEKGVPRADRTELGPDSTDAAGFLDYWVDIAELDPRELPDDVILQVLDGAEFYGPNESVYLDETGLVASYPHFGFTFHRARFDDWLRSRAQEAGAEYRVGNSVTSVETETTGSPTHTLVLSNGETVRADSLVLADGPQRPITISVLDRFLPPEKQASKLLSPRTANHIAYQEYRRFPEDAFVPDRLKFWWGWIPGHTAYPWVFPNRDRIARVGLTTPMEVSLDSIGQPESYHLLRSDDERIPAPREYVDRLLDRHYGDEYDVESDFPIVSDCGKRNGTETYPISSTRPIDSPTALNVAVVGGAMGATSAFHEGGDHLAMRTGTLAGSLAARDALSEYNDAWKRAIGSEVRRNVALAEVVRNYEPPDWDRTFAIGRRMMEYQTGASPTLRSSVSTGLSALRLYGTYRWQSLRYGSNRVVQIAERDYQIE